MDKHFKMNANPLVKYLEKMPEDFTKHDIIKVVKKFDIEMLKFMYVGGDGRLKSLDFVITDANYLDTILSFGERVDGSSLFKYIETGASDLYVVPRYCTAFIDPFAQKPCINLLCAYYNKDGEALDIAPENIVKKASESFTKITGYQYEAMGELEYYVIADDDEMFVAQDQKGYHESGPFSKFEEFRVECMHLIAKCGGMIKYGHSEVGNFRLNGKIYEQNEIEFLPTTLLNAADQLVIAKWIIRNLAAKKGINVTFAPKITAGKAGSGLHVHMRILENARNLMLENNQLSQVARKAIAGMMHCAGALTAFGNTNPTSYFRLVPHQEAPTNICWGDRNRSVLVRVPLGWTANKNLAALANPLETNETIDANMKQTVEFRCPDGSANIHLLLAGLAVACRHGFEMENAIEIAEKTYVDVNIFKDEHKEKTKTLEQLPSSCYKSAEKLIAMRAIFEKDNVFTTKMIDGIASELKLFDDEKLRTEVFDNQDKMLQLVEKYFHCG